MARKKHIPSRPYQFKPKEGTNTPTGANWAELEGIYQEAALGVYKTTTQIEELLAFPGLNEHLENKAEFDIVINGFKRDIYAFTDRLVKIHEKHQDRIGSIRGDDNMVKSLDIYGEYAQFFEEFKSVMFQTVLTITEAATYAIDKANRTNVIQDVVPKSETTWDTSIVNATVESAGA